MIETINKHLNKIQIKYASQFYREKHRYANNHYILNEILYFNSLILFLFKFCRRFYKNNNR